MSDRTADVAEIRDVIGTVVEAMRDKDPDAVLADTAADVLTYDLAPPLLTRGADRAAVKAWFDTWAGPVEYEIRDLEVTAGDTVAFATSLNRIGGVKAGDGQRSDVWVRSTIGLEKLDGRWTVTHRHESVPFYMDGSVRAAVDLKPGEA